MSYQKDSLPPSGYSYLVRYIKDGETIAVEEYYEKPYDEEPLRKQQEAIEADYYDISRSEPTF